MDNQNNLTQNPWSAILEKLAEIDGATVSTDTAFSELTTLRLGGTPRATVRCATTDAVVEAVSLLDGAGIELIIVGGGSNLVVADELGDLVAVVIEADAINMNVQGSGFEVTGAIVEAEAGAVWDDVVEMSVAAGFGGLECLSGIPGSAGATPVQNVGAYGVEVSQVLAEVQLLDRASGEVAWVAPESLDLSYRYSNLKFTARAVVLAVRFALRVDGLSAPLRYGELARRLGVTADEGAGENVRRPVAEVRREVLALRAGKGMVLDDSDHDTWSAGSFFTNPIVPAESVERIRELVGAKIGAAEAAQMPVFPAGDAKPDYVKLSAAWLIERAGFSKGYPGGQSPVSLSTKHTLALTNRGSASTADLVALARDIRDGVQDAFEVTLVPEPVWIGTSLD